MNDWLMPVRNFEAQLRAGFKHFLKRDPTLRLGRFEISWYRGGPCWWWPTRCKSKTSMEDWVFLWFWLRFLISLDRPQPKAQEVARGL